MSDLQFYQKEYYDEKIKNKFNKHWDSIKDHTEERFRIHEMNSFASLKWEREPQDFKEQLHEENETRYKMDMDARKNREQWAGDAQGYEKAWTKANEILPVLSESVARLFGAGCTIFLYGPCADGKTNVSR
ncbi:hypothetical protein E1B28_009501 [Marasmius oreades]|uniref:Uncharacterized protein n=1 Tax=Marasmius oreades TaxID=181124 RepID=A0A9P7RVW2_9AGAR|nr:uncharacterized protein E1B28_009501 [Marasmius oreades]KAG7090382.1 hypothetical protein E1B28_009501 [Marasmius oreades]